MPNPTNYIATSTELTATADAIRAKTGSAAAIEWEADEGFKDAIAAIQTGVDGLEYALCFSSPSSFTLATFNNSKNWTNTIQWTDGIHAWETWDGTTTLTASSGILYLRGSGNRQISASADRYFVLTGTNISCTGNIETLLDYATVALGNHPTMGGNCYLQLFKDCTGLISAPTLPATTLISYCYSNMFSGCTNLTSAPVLPATTLAAYCYRGMFSGCINLTSAPVLPATTMIDSCYRDMFNGCTSLISAPALPATTIAQYCYANMFYGCTSLTFAPVLPATTLANYCYNSMFENCTALETPPALPATTLATYCYKGMFKNCTSLTSIPLLSAIDYVGYCCWDMFNGCTNIKVSTTYDATNYPYAFRIPESGTGTTVTLDFYNMFTSTGGTFTGTPTINTVYYLSKPLPIDFTIDGDAVATDIRSGKITYANGSRVVGSMANGTATAPASISGTGSSVSTGTNTLTLSKTVSVTPSVTAGYIASGTAGNSSVSLTASVTTKAAATITPTTSNQTIAAGTYLTGAQTIAGNANLVAGNIKSGVSIFGVTGTFAGDATLYDNAWTSSSVTKGTATNLQARVYYPATTSIENYAIVAGGSNGSTGTTGSTYAQAYFKSSLTKTNLTALSNQYHSGLIATNIGGTALIAGGGQAGTTNIVEYYTSALTLASATNLTTARKWHTVDTIGDYALVAGGYTGSSYLNTVETYSQKLAHSTTTNLNTARYGMASAKASNTTSSCLLLAGGYNGSASAIVDTFIGTTHSTATNLNNARYNLAGASVGRYALFAGGTGSSGSFTTVDTYDRNLTHSTTTALSAARYGLNATSFNGLTPFYGGLALFAGGVNSAVVDAYTSTLSHFVTSSLSQARGNMGATSIGGYVIFAGGDKEPQSGSSSYYTASQIVDSYYFTFNLDVSVPKDYTYSFNGNLYTTVSATTTVLNSSTQPISGVVFKATTIKTGQIT